MRYLLAISWVLVALSAGLFVYGVTGPWYQTQPVLQHLTTPREAVSFRVAKSRGYQVELRVAVSEGASAQRQVGADGAWVRWQLFEEKATQPITSGEREISTPDIRALDHVGWLLSEVKLDHSEAYRLRISSDPRVLELCGSPDPG